MTKSKINVLRGKSRAFPAMSVSIINMNGFSLHNRKADYLCNVVVVVLVIL